ncbi:hypothetical protein [Streptomyces sp. WMMC940]|uniref:hypothetical protein n=1 Tax=Streptomyces sp. WMMC940 TaxID=3015153 RepID=UPI0022B73CCF|nr:hypothetical protein [Streptomyces sp. WMMC940]MCZ7462294.1 hypothetical protein [Streptomyces sp. WMMC940]
MNPARSGTSYEVPERAFGLPSYSPGVTDVLAQVGAALGAVHDHFPGGKDQLPTEATARHGREVRDISRNSARPTRRASPRPWWSSHGRSPKPRPAAPAPTAQA